MKINIIAGGKIDNSQYQAIFLEYQKRLKWKVNIYEINPRNTSNLNAFEYKKIEAELIFKSCKNNCKLIALDEKGKQLSSPDFAKLLADYKNNGDSEINFVIGGAYGLADEIIKKADLVLSFGKMTLPHLMARVILLEQIYRGWSIIENHPYHKF
jgi:23S rRNA (pseudouridine1915-N3)-methyltransferase